jgi:hypothetical protein
MNAAAADLAKIVKSVRSWPEFFMYSCGTNTGC